MRKISPRARNSFRDALAVAAVLLPVLLASGTTWSAAAQDSGPPADSIAVPIVSEVSFVGNEHFDADELLPRIRIQPNRRFLGIPGMTWWLWLYRLGESGKLGERISDAVMAGGESPAYLDTGVLAADVERLRLLYRQEGFRQAEVGARVDTVEAGNVAITFRIDAGSATYIRAVEYEGVDHLSPQQQLRLARGTLLQIGSIDPDRPLRLQARGQRYSETTLLEERRRVLSFLRDEGFAAMTRDSIRAIVFAPSPDSFDVRFVVGTGPRYRFGDVAFHVVGPEGDASVRTDSVAFEAPSDTVAGGGAAFRIEYESKLRPSLLARTLQFRPGDWYVQSDVLATKRRLEATGVFLFTDIIPGTIDSHQDGGAPRLPHRIDLRTRSRHQIRLETFMLQRTGVLGGSDTELGTGAGVTYENANLLGRAEALRVRTTGSLSADIDSTIFTAAQAEVVTSLTMPYLMRPFRFLENRMPLYEARTHLSLSLLTARRDDIGLIIRGRGNARYRIELRHNPTLTSLVDIIDLSLSNPDTLSNFRADILERFLQPVSDPVQQAQILEDYTVPQINSALRYTLRSADVNPLRRERGHSYEASVEVGNNLPYLLDRFVYTPGTVEGSLPGVPVFRKKGTPSRLIYRQYLRFVADARRYRPVGSSTVIGFKFIGGVAHPTGASDVVPFDRRFYSGGASSVRGWGLRELGPGGSQFGAMGVDGLSGGGNVTNILGGDIKIEAAVEGRQTLLRSLFAADWIGVLFLDAGNVWFGPRNPGFGEDVAESRDGRFHLDSFYRQIGVGSGFGIRVAWEYLILRLDFGIKLYDPRRPNAGLLPDGIGTMQPHFGIGHAF